MGRVDIQSTDCIGCHEHGGCRKRSLGLPAPSARFRRTGRRTGVERPGVTTSSSSTTVCASSFGVFRSVNTEWPFLEGTEHHIVGKVHISHKAHAQTVLRNEGKGHAHIHDLPGVPAGEFSLVPFVFYISDASRSGGLKSRNRFQKLLLTTAGNSCDTPGSRRFSR